MYYDVETNIQASKFERDRLDRRAYDAWRFRHMKTRPTRVVQAILTSVLGFLVR